MKYLRLKYGLSLLKIHEKYEKYIFRIIFYVSFIKNDKQTKKGTEIIIFKSLARSNVFSTKSEEQEVNLVWPNLCMWSTALHLFIPLMIMISSKLCLNEYQWISKSYV